MSVLTCLTIAREGCYRLERELGAGGIATVYSTHDERALAGRAIR